MSAAEAPAGELIGRTVLVPDHDAKGQITTYRDTAAGRLLTVETATGQRLTNIPLAGVRPVEEPSPQRAGRAKRQPGPGDLADLSLAEIAGAALAAAERGERVRGDVVALLARDVLRRAGGGEAA